MDQKRFFNLSQSRIVAGSVLKENLMSKKCLVCQGELELFHDFGKMPLGNGFLEKENFTKEYFFNLAIAFCPKCFMVQLLEQPAPEKMFHSQYPFFTGSSRKMSAHFESFAQDVSFQWLDRPNPFVVEIGSNDGTLLESFKQREIRHLGIDPSASVCARAQSRGVDCLNAFFDLETAKKVVAERGRAHAVLAANVLCHIPYLDSVLEGVSHLLERNGVLIFEEPYWGDVFEKTSYDQIYDEHVFLFSVHSIQFLLRKHGFELVTVQPQWTHGGSMRYTAARIGDHAVDASLAEFLEKEKKAGFTQWTVYKEFSIRVEKSRRDLKDLLLALKNEGQKLMGYAATSKSTTVLNYCQITPDLLPSICDTTPEKQGKFSPGAHIPIVPYEKFLEQKPNVALLFGWNHASEIHAKEIDFKEAGGKWLTYVPKVEMK